MVSKNHCLQKSPGGGGGGGKVFISGPWTIRICFGFCPGQISGYVDLKLHKCLTYFIQKCKLIENGVLLFYFIINDLGLIIINAMLPHQNKPDHSGVKHTVCISRTLKVPCVK